MNVTAAPAVNVPDVTLPEGAKFTFAKIGEVRIRTAIIPSLEAQPRGTVIIIPGRTEFIEKYIEVINDIRNRGFTVFIMDHRGQGLSDRLLDDPLKSYVKRFGDYARDLSALLEIYKEDLPRPHVHLGHSMGGCIGLQAAIRGLVHPDAIVMNAPMLGLVGIEQPGVPEILSLLSIFGFSKRPIPMQPQSQGIAIDFKVNKLTTDRRRYDIWRSYFDLHEEARVAGPTYGWIRAAVSGMRDVMSNARKLQTPALIVQPSADPIVLPEDVKKFAHKSGSKFLMIEGALHETLLEQDIFRDQFFEAFDVFMSEQRI